MGPLESQMYVWAITWLAIVLMVALAFYDAED